MKWKFLLRCIYTSKREYPLKHSAPGQNEKLISSVQCHYHAIKHGYNHDNILDENYGKTSLIFVHGCEI